MSDHILVRRASVERWRKAIADLPLGHAPASHISNLRSVMQSMASCLEQGEGEGTPWKEDIIGLAYRITHIEDLMHISSGYQSVEEPPDMAEVKQPAPITGYDGTGECEHCKPRKDDGEVSLEDAILEHHRTKDHFSRAEIEKMIADALLVERRAERKFFLKVLTGEDAPDGIELVGTRPPSEAEIDYGTALEKAIIGNQKVEIGQMVREALDDRMNRHFKECHLVETVHYVPTD